MGRLSLSELLLAKELDIMRKAGDVATNRELFYLMKEHGKYAFTSQEACDAALARLVRLGKADPHCILPDREFPFSAELKAALDGP
ncbi:MAG: hypothetical protein HC945_02330 [Nitrosarchaeum sp.]|nr:hypothetical protein [Nitrosarchaeum sp.]